MERRMKIPRLRRKIDEVDSKILSLLNERADLVIEVGGEKAKANMDLHVPQREEEIFARLVRENTGRFPGHAIRPVFREIISACRSLEGPLKLAYLGPEGTFTHLACTRRFGVSAHFVPVASIGDGSGEPSPGSRFMRPPALPQPQSWLPRNQRRPPSRVNSLPVSINLK